MTGKKRWKRMFQDLEGKKNRRQISIKRGRRTSKAEKEDPRNGDYQPVYKGGT